MDFDVDNGQRREPVNVYYYYFFYRIVMDFV